MLDHWSDPLIRSYELIIGPIGLILNVVLLVIIVRRTPEAIKTYSVMIRLITISDFIMGISVIMMTPRSFPTENRFFVMFSGFCELFSDNLQSRAEFCFLCYTEKLTSYMLNHVILSASYIYRLLLITRPFDNFDRKTVHFACYGYSILHFSYFQWVHYMCLEPMEDINAAVAMIRPELIGSDWTYYGVLNSFAPSQIVMTISSVLTPWVVLVVSAISFWRIRLYLKKLQFSPATKALHKAVFNVLLAQTLGPLLSAATSFLFIMENQRHVSVVPLLENIMQIPLGTMIVFNPLVTVYFVAPYREAALKMLHLYKPPVTAVLSAASTLH